MNHTTPDPFLSIATRGHRPRLGKEPRVLISSTTVDPKTRDQIQAWMKRTGLKQGVLMDRLITFATARRFLRPAKITAK